MVSAVSEPGNAVSDGHEEADLPECPVDSAHEGPSPPGVAAADGGHVEDGNGGHGSEPDGVGRGGPASIPVLGHFGSRIPCRLRRPQGAGRVATGLRPAALPAPTENVTRQPRSGSPTIGTSMDRGQELEPERARLAGRAARRRRGEHAFDQPARGCGLRCRGGRGRHRQGSRRRGAHGPRRRGARTSSARDSRPAHDRGAIPRVRALVGRAHPPRARSPSHAGLPRDDGDRQLRRRMEGQRAAVRNGAAFWHTDQSYEAVPSSATMLFSIKSPEAGGETQLADLKSGVRRALRTR